MASAMRKSQKIVRHTVLSAVFLFGYLALSLPHVIFLTRIGFAAWFPAIGLVMGILLGVSPWYGFLVLAADALSGRWIYHQSLLSYQGLVGAAGSAACYSLGAFALKSCVPIDQKLARMKDVGRYLFVAAIASAGSTVSGVTCLWADGAISGREYWSSAID